MKSWQAEYKSKLIAPEKVANHVVELRKKGHTIATLNGSFDLMHAGHLHIIFEASQQADLLIVALNSDQSIQHYKSPYRPIISLEYRLQMMSALAFVDYVTWFEETTPCRLLEEISPSVHVNGAEYGINPVEADVVIKNGGRLHIVELIPGLSTSAVLKKIADLQALEGQPCAF